jgi:hypothetical protein
MQGQSKPQCLSSSQGWPPKDVRNNGEAVVEACRERPPSVLSHVYCGLQDPACTSYSQALLYYKGYHAIQTHRIAHALWMRGQKVMAVALQSRMSEVGAQQGQGSSRQQSSSSSRRQGLGSTRGHVGAIVPQRAGDNSQQSGTCFVSTQVAWPGQLAASL